MGEQPIIVGVDDSTASHTGLVWTWRALNGSVPGAREFAAGCRWCLRCGRRRSVALPGGAARCGGQAGALRDFGLVLRSDGAARPRTWPWRAGAFQHGCRTRAGGASRVPHAVLGYWIASGVNGSTGRRFQWP